MPFRRRATTRHPAADTLAEAVGLDMREWWQPTVEGFWQRLQKAGMIHALSEARVTAPAPLDSRKRPKPHRWWPRPWRVVTGCPCRSAHRHSRKLPAGNSRRPPDRQRSECRTRPGQSRAGFSAFGEQDHAPLARQAGRPAPPTPAFGSDWFSPCARMVRLGYAFRCLCRRHRGAARRFLPPEGPCMGWRSQKRSGGV